MTGVGVLGAGLAIAAQDLVRNLIAGMTNMSDKRFETGDAIEIAGGVSGVVERIDLRSTLLLGFDLIPRYVPNSDLSNAVVLNYSNQKRRRVLTKLSLVHSATRAQIEDVRDRLKDYLQTSGDFATTPTRHNTSMSANSRQVRLISCSMPTPTRRAIWSISTSPSA